MSRAMDLFARVIAAMKVVAQESRSKQVTCKYLTRAVVGAGGSGGLACWVARSGDSRWATGLSKRLNIIKYRKMHPDRWGLVPTRYDHRFKNFQLLRPLSPCRKKGCLGAHPVRVIHHLLA